LETQVFNDEYSIGGIDKDPMLKSLVISAAIILLTIVVSQNILVNVISAETGKGTDIFKVILTIFGVDDTKGDVIALVNVNNGEASRVKLLETETFKPSNLTSLASSTEIDSNAGIMEYVATFPNVTVNSGDKYDACVMTTKDLNLICSTGHNSPASRPEFIDINLEGVDTGGTEQAQNIEERSIMVTNDEGSEGDD
jgi:hypothetical protein